MQSTGQRRRELMAETVPQSEFVEELWRRVELQRLLGNEVVKHYGLCPNEYVDNTNVQLEFDYGRDGI